MTTGIICNRALRNIAQCNEEIAMYQAELDAWKKDGDGKTRHAEWLRVQIRNLQDIKECLKAESR